jgi:hypothetical protein
MREIFDRLDGENVIHIEVDLDADDYKESNSWLFSVFIKFDSFDESKEGFEEFLEFKESLILGLEHEGQVKYVGSRVIDGWSELYFYASTSKELDSMATAILRGSGYVYESNVVKDPKWNFYDLRLCPNELELAHIQSAKIIFLLEEEGDDLSIKREVEHYISFETPTQKNRFLNTLDLEGFRFKDDISSEEFEHGVALVKEHSVEYAEVKKTVEELFEKVKRERGYYEGWSTILVESDEE